MKGKPKQEPITLAQMSRIFRVFWYSVNDVIYHLKLNRTQGESKLIAEPHTHKAEETHELIFSWLSWVAVFHVGAYARRRRRSRIR